MNLKLECFSPESQMFLENFKTFPVSSFGSPIFRSQLQGIRIYVYLLLTIPIETQTGQLPAIRQ